MHDRLFDAELRSFQTSFRRFIAAEIAPSFPRWAEAGIVDRGVFAAAGAQGFLCMTQSPDHGGMGLDFRYSALVAEELSAQGFGDVFFSLHRGQRPGGVRIVVSHYPTAVISSSGPSRDRTATLRSLLVHSKNVMSYVLCGHLHSVGGGAPLLRLAQMVRQVIPALVVMALHQQSQAPL